MRHAYYVITWQNSLVIIYISFLFFSFAFILDLLHRRECRKVSHHKCHSHMTGSHSITSHDVTVSHHMMSHDWSHDRHGKIVHRPYSSCISSVENLIETLSSSLCQSLNKEQLALFQLGVQLSYILELGWHTKEVVVSYLVCKRCGKQRYHVKENRDIMTQQNG